MSKEKEPSSSKKKIKIVVSGATALMIFSAGLSLYHHWDQPAASNPIRLTHSNNDISSVVASSGKRKSQIRLNTDSDQPTPIEQPKERKKQNFSLKNNIDNNVVYIVDLSEPDKNQTVMGLVVDPAKNAPLPEIPKKEVPPILSTIILDREDEIIVPPDIDNENENTGLDLPGEGTTEEGSTGEGNPEIPTNPEEPQTPGDTGEPTTPSNPSTPSNPNNPTDPVPSEPEKPNPGYKTVALIVPESLYTQIKYYTAADDTASLQNAVFYGGQVKKQDEDYAKIIDLIVSSAVKLKDQAVQDPSNGYAYSSLQLINSLQLEDQKIQALQAEIRKELYKQFLNNEIQLYVAKSSPSVSTAEVSASPESGELEPAATAENPEVTKPSTSPQEDKDIVYYVGKYNEITGEKIEKSDFKEADKKLLEGAKKDSEAEENTAEALNKYQMDAQYSPEVSEEAKQQKEELVKKQVKPLEERKPGEYEEIPPETALETLTKLKDSGQYVQVIEQGGSLVSNVDIATVVNDASNLLMQQTDSMEDELDAYTSATKQKKIVTQYQTLAEAPGVPAEYAKASEDRLYQYRLMIEARDTATDDLAKAVILASEAATKEKVISEGARSLLNKLSSDLLAAADGYSLEKEEQAYEILSTRPVINSVYAQKATSRKQAISYSKTANDMWQKQNANGALQYAGESNRLYPERHLNDELLHEISNSLLEKASGRSFQEQLKTYNLLASVPELPNDINQVVITRKEAVDQYIRGKDEQNLEKAVYYLGESWEKEWTKDLAAVLLDTKSKQLFTEANEMRGVDFALAGRYYKTLVNTSGVSDEIKQASKQAMDELKVN
ncbi:hypothetical protein [Priestia koreensis]|uniref:hypothetical protein n=1 Tax=Priestia koreensis TaxID=284581 RepID=UPI0028F6EA71|nr:hypothetical protein [Priestia koreensis]